MMPPNTKLRGERAAQEVSDLPQGPGIDFDDLAKRYGVSLEYLSDMVEHERRSRSLTPCQRIAIIGYARGQRMKEIGLETGTSHKTIGMHISMCSKKLGLRNRVLALHYCILAGWIAPGEGLSDRARDSALAQHAKDDAENKEQL